MSNKKEVFNFDNEIVIGITKKPKSGVEKKSTLNSKVSQKQKLRKKNKNTKKRKLIKDIIKWFILLSTLTASFIFFMMSPLFNIEEIQVIDNGNISSDTIISLSEIKIGENIYKTSSKKIEKNIKQNAYVESVKVSRKLPNKLELTVKIRKASFMIEYANSYAYMNNQGYILEISNEKLEVPIISKISTSEENIKPGNRMNSDDLEKLVTVLKIIESANGNEIGSFITRIDIEDKQNYILELEGKKKTVYIGDASDLSNKMLHVKAILIETEGLEGEIYINKDLNKQKPYFREKQ